MPGAATIFFEGLPGSGKTTTSREITVALRARGEECAWASELDADHPFFPAGIRKRHREAQFDDVCLSQWRHLAHWPRQTTWILEGTALQTTVRFMFEQRWDFERIRDYWCRFEGVVRHRDAVHVYLAHPDPEPFLRNHTMAVREDVWSKITRHVVTTPVGVQLLAEGADAEVEFWLRYRALCDTLLAAATLPVLAIDISNGWGNAQGTILDWLANPR
jgi:hypothetical protein